MNEFDKFIEEGDKELKIDTSSRIVSEGNKTPSKPQSNLQVSPKSPSRSLANSKAHRQLTPTRIDDFSLQPLKIDNEEKTTQRRFSSVASASPPPSGLRPISLSRTHSISRPNLINKRRSLIQPIIAQSPPDIHSHPTNIGNISNTSANDISFSHVTSNNTSHNNNNSNTVDNGISQLSLHSRTSSTNSVVLESNDISSLLKNLANKELELFESKQKIEELKKQLLYHERIYEQHSSELQHLKELVGKQLNENATISSTPLKSKEDSIKKQGLHSRRSNTSQNKHLTAMVTPNKTQKYTQDQEAQQPANSSVWSRPLAIFNQFDQIIQNELERSLNWDNEEIPNVQNRASQQQQQFNQTRSNNSEELHQQETLNDSRTASQYDPTSSVSKSIWSFVSDVKSGLLGINEEPADESADRSDSTDHNSNIKEFKTTKKSESNKLKFIEDENHGRHKIIEMDNFV